MPPGPLAPFARMIGPGPNSPFDALLKTPPPVKSNKRSQVEKPSSTGLPVAGTKQAWAWPAGSYRFLVARRLASGVAVAPGTYRVRVTGTGPDGTSVRTESGPFTLD